MEPPTAAASQSVRAIRWENVPCPLCTRRDEETFLVVQPEGEAESFTLVRCRRCQLVYMNPRPDEQSIGQFYPADYEWYHPPQRRLSWRKRTIQQLRRLVMADRYGTQPGLKNQREKVLAKLAGPWLRPDPDALTSLPFQGEGRLLDFGCGSGWYLQQMRELGWNVVGMDFNAQTVRQVRERFGIPALTGTLPHPEVKPASFDVVTMGAVLEHVHRPHEVIEAAAQALKPGGCLVVSVPNIASWGYRYFGLDWWGLQIPHHLLHFTPATLRRLLHAHGLEVREVRVVGQPGWMRRTLATVNAQPENPVHGRPLVRLAQLRSVRSLLMRWTVWSNQADCLQAYAYRRRARPTIWRVA